MIEELKKFIINNETKIKSLGDKEKTELAGVFLVGFQITENVRIDELRLQKLNYNVTFNSTSTNVRVDIEPLL
jgi:hypothetical protein